MCAHGWAGQTHINFADLLKILPPKFSDQNFLNLSIHAREARGNPIPPYAALRAARISASEKPLSLILEPMSGIEPETSFFAFTSVYLHLVSEG